MLDCFTVALGFEVNICKAVRRPDPIVNTRNQNRDLSLVDIIMGRLSMIRNWGFHCEGN